PTCDKQITRDDDEDEIGPFGAECGVLHALPFERPRPHPVPVRGGGEISGPHGAAAQDLCDAGVDRFGFPCVTFQPWQHQTIAASRRYGLATADGVPTPIPPPRWLADEHLGHRVGCRLLVLTPSRRCCCYRFRYFLLC